MAILRVVNIIPQSMSGETAQDSEPNLAVNPVNTKQIVATAFTPPPMGGSNAPIFLSSNGGQTWSVRNVIPGAGATFPTRDITVSFATAGGMLYAAILRGDDPARRMQILRSPALGLSGTAAMVVLSDRTGPDQPWVVTKTSGSSDRLWVGNNDLGAATQKTATVDSSANARVASPTFGRTVVEARTTEGGDGPPVRLAAHSDGTVYAAFIRWAHTAPGGGTSTMPFINLDFDVVVTRDDKWGTGTNPFTALTDPRDHVFGTRVADGLYTFWNATMGQERLGADLSIAVDPRNSATVWVAWGYKPGGVSGSIPWAIDVARSTDSGSNWAPVRRTIVRGKNPALAVNSGGQLGFLYQQLTDTTNEWVTRLEVTSDAFDTAPETYELHRAPSATPARDFYPYLGDYVRLLSVKKNFYGIFSGSNEPDPAHFPNGVTYQRNVDWTTQRLLGVDGASTVSSSIDPFFFSLVDDTFMPPPIIPRTGPISRTNIVPIRPPGPPSPIITRGPIEAPEPPTDLEL